jgi:hypothetical protein
MTNRNISLNGNIDILWRNYQTSATDRWQLNRTPTIISSEAISMSDAKN